MKLAITSFLVAGMAMAAVPKKQALRPTAAADTLRSYSVAPKESLTCPYVLLKNCSKPTWSRHFRIVPTMPQEQTTHSTPCLRNSPRNERSCSTRLTPPNAFKAKTPGPQRGSISKACKRTSWPISVLACGAGTGDDVGTLPESDPNMCKTLNVQSKSKTASLRARAACSCSPGSHLAEHRDTCSCANDPTSLA